MIFSSLRLWLCCLALMLMLARPAYADPTHITVTPMLTVAHVRADGDIILTNGETLHLRGIKTTPDAPAFLTTLTQNKFLYLGTSARDRYGRLDADAVVQIPPNQEIWLQDATLDAGLAFVYPPTGDEPRLNELMHHEAAARAAHRGIWANNTPYADTPAAEADKKIGQFAFVAGRVLDVTRIKNMIYLNFGADYRTDFTVAIRTGDLRTFKKAGIDPILYKGKMVRVRGWVTRKGGALINATHPAQITVLEK